MRINEDLARIRIEEAIQAGLKSQHVNRALTGQEQIDQFRWRNYGLRIAATCLVVLVTILTFIWIEF